MLSNICCLSPCVLACPDGVDCVFVGVVVSETTVVLGAQMYYKRISLNSS